MEANETSEGNEMEARGWEKEEGQTGGGNQIAIMSATVNSLLAMKHKL